MVYKEAALLAKSVAGGAGLKNKLYNSDIPSQNLRGVAFLATNALKQQKIIDGIIRGTDLKHKLGDESNWWLARVLVIELCLGRKSFRATNEFEKLVYKRKKAIRSLAANVKWEKTTEIPRYVRVNTLVTSLNQIEAELKDRGFVRVKFHSKELNARKCMSFLRKVDNLESNEYLLDVHVPNLLIFHPKAKLADWDLVDNGTLLLQDKSSCFVAPLLAPHPGSVVLDMCAAPGFKTQHLATYLQGLGQIIAVDKNVERFKALSDLTEKFELKNVQCLNKDALECLESDEREKIEYILLDPPCSGSGVVTNYDFSAERKKDSKRLQGLHNLQCALLRNALTNYPAARRVVYSTCSMNEEENEQVIEEFKQPPCGFELVDLSKFYREVSCGFDTYSTGICCIRLSPQTERTNGFFIAMFERVNPVGGVKNSESDQLDRETKRRRITLEEYPSAGETVTKEIIESGTSSSGSTSSEESEDDAKEAKIKEITVKTEVDEKDVIRSIIKKEKEDPGYDVSIIASTSGSADPPPFRMNNVEEYENDIANTIVPSILSVSVGVSEPPPPRPTPPPPPPRPTPPPLISIRIPDQQNMETGEPQPPEPEWVPEYRYYDNDGNYPNDGHRYHSNRFPPSNTPRNNGGRGGHRRDWRGRPGPRGRNGRSDSYQQQRCQGRGNNQQMSMRLLTRGKKELQKVFTMSEFQELSLKQVSMLKTKLKRAMKEEKLAKKKPQQQPSLHQNQQKAVAMITSQIFAWRQVCQLKRKLKNEKEEKKKREAVEGENATAAITATKGTDK